MIKKVLLCVFAALQFLCATMSVSYRVSVGGQELPGTFSKKELRRCGIVSCAAVGEIARGNSDTAGYSAAPVFGLRGPDGDSRALNDALITSSPGVDRYCEIYLGDVYCGAVADPAELENVAVPAFSGAAGRPVYSYAGRASDYTAVCSAMAKAAARLT